MAKDVTTTKTELPRRLDGGEATRTRAVFRPPVDIYESDDKVVVLAEMPGVGEDGFDITLERRVLTIRGRTPPAEHEGYQQVYAEYRDGDYERAFTLSEDIDPDGIHAAQRDGVIAIELPKRERARTRKIEVKTA